MMTSEQYVGFARELAIKGAFEQAEKYLGRALELRADYPEALNNLGVLLLQGKDTDKAETCLRRAIELRPDYPEAYVNLGEIMNAKNRPDEAEHLFRRAIELNPSCAEAFNSLGVVWLRSRLPAEAAILFRKATELKPDYPEAYHNLGSILNELNILGEAEMLLRRALVLRPDFPEACNMLGLVCKKTDRPGEAEDWYRRAIKIRPGFPQAYVNLAMVLKDTDRLDEAEMWLRKVIKLYPDFPEADFALGILALLRGRYDEWWDKYELRRKIMGYREPDIPCWQGEDLTGRRILLFHEQGFGDTIQFIRYAYKVAEAALATHLWVPQPLAQLVSSSLTNCTLVNGEAIRSEEYDFACPLPSLPFVFRTTQDTIPGNVPYLRPNAELSAKRQAALAAIDGGGILRVGIAWAGSPEHKNDRNRSIPFELFARLLETGRVSWVSLQAGKRAVDLKEKAERVVDCSDDLTDFAETAAVIDNLDLVISVDTSVAHLAGAMGKKAWVLLPFAPDWRWQLEREDSPWYPTMLLFRQRRAGDWQEVLDRVGEALSNEISKSRLNAKTT